MSHHHHSHGYEASTLHYQSRWADHICILRSSSCWPSKHRAVLICETNVWGRARRREETKAHSRAVFLEKKVHFLKMFPHSLTLLSVLKFFHISHSISSHCIHMYFLELRLFQLKSARLFLCTISFHLLINILCYWYITRILIYLRSYKYEYCTGNTLRLEFSYFSEFYFLNASW